MITLDDQIKCVEREIAMRQRVYRKWVADGRMDKDNAAQEVERMTAVLRTLTVLRRRCEQLDDIATKLQRLIA